ncbi:MAG: hypothetical protein U7123_18675 [Potamolinea sp.]
MLLNSRKTGYRSGTVFLALLAVLTLSSCGGNKADEPTSPEAPSRTTTQAPPGGTTTAGKDQNSGPGSKTSTKGSKTLSAEAQKLGVKPTGKECPKDAAVKGNLNKKGDSIYHQAKDKGYVAVNPEICFKDIATAEKAGFRAPKGAAKP